MERGYVTSRYELDGEGKLKHLIALETISWLTRAQVSCIKLLTISSVESQKGVIAIDFVQQ